MEIVIIGASGFGTEVAWVCQRAGIGVAGFCDDAPDKQTGSHADLPLLGTVAGAARRLGRAMGYHVAIGDNRARQRVAAQADALGWHAVTIADPTAVCAPDVILGPGCYIGIGCVVSCGVKLGRHVMVNLQVTVGHDAVIGDFSQLCPGVRVSGGCRIGAGALLGSNAVTIPGRTIGAWSVLGAGSVAFRDLADGERQVRIP